MSYALFCSCIDLGQQKIYSSFVFILFSPQLFCAEPFPSYYKPFLGYWQTKYNALMLNRALRSFLRQVLWSFHLGGQKLWLLELVFILGTLLFSLILLCASQNTRGWLNAYSSQKITVFHSLAIILIQTQKRKKIRGHSHAFSFHWWAK